MCFMWWKLWSSFGFSNRVSSSLSTGNSSVVTPVNSESVDDNISQSSSFVCSSALFLLKARDVHKVSQTALNEMTEELAKLTMVGIGDLKLKIENVLQTNNVDTSEVVELNKVFNNSFFCDPFSSLTSEYLQNKY